jgi:hypothetical protein
MLAWIEIIDNGSARTRAEVGGKSNLFLYLLEEGWCDDC